MTTDNNNGDMKNTPQNELSVQNLPTGSESKALPPAKKRWPWQVRLAFGTAAAGLAVGVAYNELAVSSTLQSKFFTSLYKGDVFTKVVTTPPPAQGNTDVERGYNEVQRIRKEAEAAGDKVSAQVPWKDRRVGPLQLAPIFPRKQQAGITILDTNGVRMYSGDTPHNYYKSFTDVPDIVVKSFCLVEDKDRKSVV